MSIPNIGTFMVFPRNVAEKIGSFNVGLFTTSCGNPPPIATNADIVNGFSEGFANSIKPHRSNQVSCPPCEDLGNYYGHFPIAGTNKLLFSNGFNVLFNDGTPDEEIVKVFSGKFPSGFLAQALQVRYGGPAKKSGSGQDITQLRLYYNTSVVLTINNPDISGADFTASSSTGILPFGNSVGALTALLAQFGYDFTLAENTPIVTGCGTFNSAQVNVSCVSMHLIGNYLLWSTNLSLFQEDANTIVANGDGFLDSINDNDMFVDYTDPISGLLTSIKITNIVRKTRWYIIFTLPAGIPANTAFIVSGGWIAGGHGTQFSGRVNLGILNIQLAEGSGIYTIVPGKTNDTYYDRSITPATTINLKIPDPFIKTGFVD